MAQRNPATAPTAASQVRIDVKNPFERTDKGLEIIRRRGNNFARYQMWLDGVLGGKIDMKVCGPMGIAGEAGEVVDYIKKVMFHNFDLDPDKLMEELGDVLAYVAMTATAYGMTLEDVAAANVKKLTKRYPNGFDPKRSQNRKS